MLGAMTPPDTAQIDRIREVSVMQTHNGTLSPLYSLPVCYVSALAVAMINSS